jgi:hypothetical protein
MDMGGVDETSWALHETVYGKTAAAQARGHAHGWRRHESVYAVLAGADKRGEG